MGIKLHTAPTLEPITLAQVKANSNIDTTDFDTMISDVIIPWVRQAAENRMGSVIMQRTVDQTLDEFPVAEIALEQPPAWNHQCVSPLPLSITSVTYIDEAGDTQTVDAADYSLDDSNWPFWLLPAVDTDWPDTREQANAVTIRVVKGYDAITKIPADIRQWLLLAADFAINNRGLMDTTGRMVAIPGGFADSLLDPYRVFVV
jgi:uncharacterized phiE125 gp8 family phage protein